MRLLSDSAARIDKDRDEDEQRTIVTNPPHHGEGRALPYRRGDALARAQDHRHAKIARKTRPQSIGKAGIIFEQNADDVTPARRTKKSICDPAV